MQEAVLFSLPAHDSCLKNKTGGATKNYTHNLDMISGAKASVGIINVTVMIKIDTTLEVGKHSETPFLKRQQADIICTEAQDYFGENVAVFRLDFDSSFGLFINTIDFRVRLPKPREYPIESFGINLWQFVK